MAFADSTEAHKTIYEGLQAVNAYLTAEGEALLVKVVEDIRTALRAERPAEWPYTELGTIGTTEVLLGSWVEFGSGYVAEEPADEPKPGSLEAKAKQYPGLRLV